MAPSTKHFGALLRATVPAVAVMCVLLLGTPVMADVDTAQADAGDGASTNAGGIAESLAEDPLYTDPAYESVFTEQQAEELSSQLAADDRALFIIVVPLISGDDWDGDVRNMASAVHNRMPDEALVDGAGHYVVSDGSSVTGLDQGAEAEETPAHHSVLAASYRGNHRASVGDDIRTAVDILLHEDPREAYDQAVEDYDGPSSSWPWFAYGIPTWVIVALAVLVVVILGGLGALFLVRRRSAERRAELRTAPLRTKYANADAARLDELSQTAANALSELGLRLAGAQPHPDDADAGQALSAALEAHAAANKAYEMIGDGHADLADAAGTLVLLDYAASNLERATAGQQRDTRERLPRHCYANPLHGAQTTENEWRPVGNPRSIRVPLCADCAAAVHRRDSPTPLLVEHEGREVPYYSVPAEKSVWSATGFGTLRSDLVARIMRGDLRRNAADETSA